MPKQICMEYGTDFGSLDEQLGYILSRYDVPVGQFSTTKQTGGKN